MTFRQALLAIPFTALLASPAAALTFNFTMVSGDTLTPGQSAAFSAAGAAWSSILSDAVNVNVSIGFRDLGASGGGAVLGQTSESRGTISYAGFRTAYAADAKSSSDATALASLSAAPAPANVALTYAEAKALALLPAAYAASDGTIEFNSNIAFANTRADLNSGNYDLIGVATHEIGHLLGFISAVDDTSPTTPTALDLFRYGSAGVRSFSKGASAFFSIDGGVTSLAGFSDGNSYQASHWLQGTTSGGLNALMNPALAAGVAQYITPLDTLALDVLGYDLAVPEPATLVLMVPALLGLAWSRRAAAAR